MKFLAFRFTAFQTFCCLSSLHITLAKRHIRAESGLNAYFENSLQKRNCANPCGYNGQLCCASGETCYTDEHNQAQCGFGHEVEVAITGIIPANNVGEGYWAYYTSTFLETDLVTRVSVFSSFVAVHPTPVVTPVVVPVPEVVDPSCQYALDETPCGHICCQSGFYCLNPETGKCADAGAGSSGHASFLPTASAPLRPTASTLVVVTATDSATTTVPFEQPVATGANVDLTTSVAGSDGGLSGGAIAGIVIGVIFGIILLALLCFFCCLKGAANRLLAIFGLGGRRRKREEYVEEYHRHSQYGGQGNGRWHGQTRPSRPSKKKTGGLGGLGAAAAGLGTLGLLLGLKRKNNRRTEKSDYTSSSGYYSSDFTSSSKSLPLIPLIINNSKILTYDAKGSSSSGGRTRDTRRSSRR